MSRSNVRLKRYIAIFLAFLMVAVTCPDMANARGYVIGPFNNWIADTTKPSSIDYTTKVITIGNDTAEFAWIAMVNNYHWDDTTGAYAPFAHGFEGWTIKLSHDLKISYFYHGGHRYWDPIGIDYTIPFRGHFDGCGHTLSELDICSGTESACYGSDGKNYSNYGSYRAIGLFGYVDGGTIENFNISGKIDNEDYGNMIFIGSVAGSLNNGARLRNIRSTVNITTHHLYISDFLYFGHVIYIGGLAGEVISRNTNNIAAGKADAARIENCAFAGSVNVSQGSNTAINDYNLEIYAGGITGYLYADPLKSSDKENDPNAYMWSPQIKNCYACTDPAAFSISPGKAKYTPHIGAAVGLIQNASMDNVFADSDTTMLFANLKSVKESFTKSIGWFKSSQSCQLSETVWTGDTALRSAYCSLYNGDKDLLTIMNHYVDDNSDGHYYYWKTDSATGLPVLNFGRELGDANNAQPRTINIGLADVIQTGTAYSPNITVTMPSFTTGGAPQPGPTDGMQVVYNTKGSSDFTTTAPTKAGTYIITVFLPGKSRGSYSSNICFPPVTATKEFTICDIGTPVITFSMRNATYGTESDPVVANVPVVLTSTLKSTTNITGDVYYYIDGTYFGYWTLPTPAKNSIVFDFPNHYTFTSYGKHTVEIKYKSADNFNKDTSQTFTVDVKKQVLWQGATDYNCPVTATNVLWFLDSVPVKTFEFSSSDPTIASVDTDGKVTLNRVGVVTLTAYFPGDEDYYPCTGTCTLTVTPAMIHVNAEPVNILKGQSIPVPKLSISGQRSTETLESLALKGLVLPAVTVGTADTSKAGTINVPITLTGGSAGNEYQFAAFPTTVEVNISKVYVTANDYSTDKDPAQWQSGTITVTPKNGYTKISSDDGKTWQTSLKLSTEGENQIAFCLKKDDGTTTENTTLSYKIDNTLPAAAVSFASVPGSSWDKFWNTVTFGLLCKGTQTVTVTASDTPSGIAKAEYLLTGEPFDKQADVTGTWTELTLENGKGSFEIAAESKACVYVRATDYAGNTVIINSDGIVVAGAPETSNPKTGDNSLALWFALILASAGAQTVFGIRKKRRENL